MRACEAVHRPDPPPDPATLTTPVVAGSSCGAPLLPSKNRLLPTKTWLTGYPPLFAGSVVPSENAPAAFPLML